MTARLYTFASLTAAAGLVLLWLSLQLPGGAEVTTLIGPRTWPLGIILAMLALVALMLVLLALRGPAQFIEREDEDAAAADMVDGAVTRDDSGGFAYRHIAVLAATIAYTVAMAYTGYLLATAVFAAIATVLLGERKPLRILLTTGTAVALVAVVFDRLLNIPLP